MLLARDIVSQVLKEGDTAVDATAGNGNDTVFLAHLVGPRGRVFSFDIQPQALDRTAELLSKNNLQERVVLIAGGHQELKKYITAGVAAIMVNLGYLPGGDHRVVTRRETTLAALKAGLEILKPGGVMTVIMYPGHPEGAHEKEALLEYCRKLDGRLFSVCHHAAVNRRKPPPELFAVRREI